MASVYAASHRNGLPVAIKVLHPELAASPVTRERFAREGYVANLVSHPGTVAVLDDDITEDGHVFLVMELLEGFTLQEHFDRKGALETSEVLQVAIGVLDVLEAAHQCGIVHRDIKPQNVFLTSSNRIKLLDFGVARLLEDAPFAALPEGGRTPFALAATHAGSTVGTPSFMSPEQARGCRDQIDARTDIWGVGAMMFCLLSGRKVHEGSTVQGVLSATATFSAPPLAMHVTGVSPDVAALVDRALRLRKEDRWQGAAQMKEAASDALRTVEERLPSGLSALSESGAADSSAVVRGEVALEASAESTAAEWGDRQVQRVNTETPRAANRPHRLTVYFATAGAALSLAGIWRVRPARVEPTTPAAKVRAPEAEGSAAEAPLSSRNLVALSQNAEPLRAPDSADGPDRYTGHAAGGQEAKRGRTFEAMQRRTKRADNAGARPPPDLPDGLGSELPVREEPVQVQPSAVPESRTGTAVLREASGTEDLARILARRK